MDLEVELAAPSFIVAVPQLGDPNFNRSVVYLLEHGDEGTMGLVLSRATDLSIGDFCDNQGIEFQGDRSEWIHMGGPVQTQRAFVLHTPGKAGPETEIVQDGVRLSYSIESLKLLAQYPPDALRVYLGYAGWGPGQLAKEMAEGAWLLAAADADLIFRRAPDDLWEVVLRRMGIDPAQLMFSGATH